MTDIRLCSSTYTVDKFEYEHGFHSTNEDVFMNSIRRRIVQQLTNLLLKEDMIDFKTVYHGNRVEIIGTCGVATKQTVVDKQAEIDKHVKIALNKFVHEVMAEVNDFGSYFHHTSIDKLNVGNIIHKVLRGY